MHDAERKTPTPERKTPTLVAALLAGVAAACLLAVAPAANAALPGPRIEPGAFCTRSSCATDAASGWGGSLGFAAASLACIGLGRRRAAGTPEAGPGLRSSRS
jgi:hypothetical protein